MEKNGKPEATLFVDETGFEESAGHCGRLPSNYPLPSFAPKVKPDKTPVICVVGFHWLVQVISFNTNYTTAIFEQTMEHIIILVLPHDCYLVMDIASIHNDDHLAQILAQKNITLVKLPPYSYDLNPIEMIFGPAKAYSLRHKDIDNKSVQILSEFSRGNSKLLSLLLEDTLC